LKKISKIEIFSRFFNAGRRLAKINSSLKCTPGKDFTPSRPDPVPFRYYFGFFIRSIEDWMESGFLPQFISKCKIQRFNQSLNLPAALSVNFAIVF